MHINFTIPAWLIWIVVGALAMWAAKQIPFWWVVFGLWCKTRRRG